MNNQPPKKIWVAKIDITMIELYSARKNNANPILEYSTLNPETSSDSASGKSNGGLLVSAREDIKKITNIGNRGITYHNSFCASTMSFRFKEPTHKRTFIIIIPIETS